MKNLILGIYEHIKSFEVHRNSDDVLSVYLTFEDDHVEEHMIYVERDGSLIYSD